VVHAWNPSTHTDDAGGLRVQGQPGLYGDTPYKKIKVIQPQKWLGKINNYFASNISRN
jgi:hypothetical protein